VAVVVTVAVAVKAANGAAVKPERFPSKKRLIDKRSGRFLFSIAPKFGQRTAAGPPLFEHGLTNNQQNEKEPPYLCLTNQTNKHAKASNHLKISKCRRFQSRWQAPQPAHSSAAWLVRLVQPWAAL
jgi:hypothetical protein